MLTCILCISNFDINYMYNGNLFCKLCYNNIMKTITKKCDICGLVCNDSCLTIFDKALKL